jgi:hypothetical protein
MKDHIQSLAEWPVPGANRWINMYHLMVKRYLELDDPAVPLPPMPIVVINVVEDPDGTFQESRWREHVAWAEIYGIADEVLKMLKISPSVLRPEAFETFQLQPWTRKL